MNHGIRSLALLMPLGIALLNSGCTNPPKSLAGEAGFVDGYLDAAKLNGLMADPSCAYIRFYNARRTSGDTQGTVIAIATKDSGEEIYNGTTLKYKMYDRISKGTTLVVDLTRDEAITHIGYVKAANEMSYSAKFKRTEVSDMITAAGCNGVKLTPERLATYSMRMAPVKLAGSSGTVNPAPPSVVCTEPCPSFCGGTIP